MQAVTPQSHQCIDILCITARLDGCTGQFLNQNCWDISSFKSRIARGDFTSSFLDGGLAALFLELAMAELKERVWGTYNKNIWTSAFFLCVCVCVCTRVGLGKLPKDIVFMIFSRL